MSPKQENRFKISKLDENPYKLDALMTFDFSILLEIGREFFKGNCVSNSPNEKVFFSI
jgi:hypothetical protein